LNYLYNIAMFKYLRLVPTIGVRIMFDYLTKFKPYAKHPEKTPLPKRYLTAQKTIQSLLHHCHSDIRIQGFENYQKLVAEGKKHLVVCNHMSFLDPLLMVALFDEPLRMVGKEEIKKMFLMNEVVSSIDGIFMDRSDLKQSLKIILECSRCLKAGEMNVLIFPEGTRNKKPGETDPAPYHAGSFKAATRVGAPILPITIYGTQYGLSSKNNYRSCPVSVIIGEPIYESDYKDISTDELAKQVQDWTTKNVYKLREYDKAYFEAKNQKIPYKKHCKGQLFTEYKFDSSESSD